VNARSKLLFFAGFVLVLGLASMPPAAAAVEAHYVEPFAVTYFVPCANNGAGEFVDLVGSVDVLVTSTINGNKVSGTVRFRPEGITGVGATTGDTYYAHGVSMNQFTGSLQNNLYTTTIVGSFLVISPGPGTNLHVHEAIHFTINANGEVTADIYNSGFHCN
jgi:hypothetical protein